jgi:hypothetical protein
LIKQGIIISKIVSQNAHGLCRRPCDSDGKLLPHNPHDYTRYEHLIATMKLKQLDVYFVQETWLEGNVFDEVINGYHVFCPNGEKGKHNFRRAAIILSSRYHDGWKASRAHLPITTNSTREFAGRYISINLIIISKNCLGKQVQGKQGNKHLALTLASVYYPCTKTGKDETYLRFLDILNTLLNYLSAKSKLIMGANISTNIGKLNNLHSANFRSALGPHKYQNTTQKMQAY